MRHRTHLATAMSIGLPLMATTDTLSAGTITALAIGTLLPDIDEEVSWIGCRTRKISNFLSTIFGHRGVTHSMFFLVLVLMTLVLLVSFLNFSVMFTFYFILGYLIHLVADGFSKPGIKLLLPMSDKQIRFGNFYYINGGKIESLIFFAAIFIIIFECSILFW
ncbi:metal-dependent hydrolase [Aeribacillus sp. FSL K6-1121]|uniref:metal-dependent hydrolase n=1 Tax=Aeribacillus sp. FSL K6-1121 TaxID=2954745 RepID=UPI0030F94B1C